MDAKPTSIQKLCPNFSGLFFSFSYYYSYGNFDVYKYRFQN